MKLESNQKFSLTDENHLFQCMALTSTNERELGSMLPREVMVYLRNLRQPIVKPVSQNHSTQNTPMTKLLPQTNYKASQPAKEHRYGHVKYS